MSQKKILVFCLAALAAFAIAACDFSPSSPFEGFEEEQRQGATLTGTFRGSGATAVGTSAQLTLGGTYAAESTVASASEYDVATVVVLDEKGDEIASVDVVDDSFTLRGLPESFSLVFLDAKGVQLGDPMEFDGVKPNQEIDIVVDVVEGKVVLLEESHIERAGHPIAVPIEGDVGRRSVELDAGGTRMVDTGASTGATSSRVLPRLPSGRGISAWTCPISRKGIKFMSEACTKVRTSSLSRSNCRKTKKKKWRTVGR